MKSREALRWASGFGLDAAEVLQPEWLRLEAAEQARQLAARVELELGVRLPGQYADFLSSRGHAVIGELTVFGCSEEMSDINALPCVIGATRRLGSLFGLARHELVLAQENGILFVLDCEHGLVSEMDWLGRRSVVADSFEQWLMRVGDRDGAKSCNTEEPDTRD